MPPRDFNLDELLGQEYVEHYLKFITPRPDNIFGRELPAGRIAGLDGDLQFHQEFAVHEENDAYSWDQWSEGIEQRGLGAATCSTSYDLAVLGDRFIWDVCEYYRTLRVDTRATRSQLKAALRRLGRRQGQHTAKQAYAAHQLLNDVVRRLYDRAVPTKPFFLDLETTERIKKAAVFQAARERHMHPDEVTEEQVDQVFSRWGINRNKPGQEQTAEEIGERQRLRDEFMKANESREEGRPEHALGGSLSPWALKWSWYAWHERSDRPGERWDARYLERWQGLLREAFAYRGVTVRFAVGLHSGSGWKLFRLSDGVCIVFLARDEYPDEFLAEAAVDYIVESEKVVQGRQSRHGRKNRREGI